MSLRSKFPRGSASRNSAIWNQMDPSRAETQAAHLHFCRLERSSRRTLRLHALLRNLEAGIDWFALEREDSEHAFMYAVKRFGSHKSLEGFDSEGKLPLRKRSFEPEAARPESR
jgi:hypothetical protein